MQNGIFKFVEKRFSIKHVGLDRKRDPLRILPGRDVEWNRLNNRRRYGRVKYPGGCASVFEDPDGKQNNAVGG